MYYIKLWVSITDTVCHIKYLFQFYINIDATINI